MTNCLKLCIHYLYHMSIIQNINIYIFSPSNRLWRGDLLSFKRFPPRKVGLKSYKDTSDGLVLVTLDSLRQLTAFRRLSRQVAVTAYVTTMDQSIFINSWAFRDGREHRHSSVPHVASLIQRTLATTATTARDGWGMRDRKRQKTIKTSPTAAIKLM